MKRSASAITRLRQIGVPGILLATGFASLGLALDPSQPAASYLRSRFTNAEGLNDNIVNQIVQSRDGFLWLSLGYGDLSRFDGRHFTDFPFPNVTALAIGPDGDLWVGSEEGLFRIRAADLNQFGTLPSIAYHPGTELSNRVTAVHFSRSGDLWVGTANGLYRFERGGFSNIIPRLAIIRMEEAANGHLLVITGQGFVEWDGTHAVPHPEVAARLGVRVDRVFHVLQDRHGVTWFCTDLGAARSSRGSLEKLPPYGVKGREACHLYEDPDGNVWVATADGLFRGAGGGLEPVAPNLNVRVVYGDRDGNLWIGTNGDGLIRFRDRAVRMFTTTDGLPNKLVMTVLASQGKVWAGTNCGGLSLFDGQRFQTYSEKDGLRNTCVWSLAEGPKHDLWIGTYGGGAFRFHDGRFTQYAKSEGLTSDTVSAVLAARDGSQWFATSVGVSHMRDGQVRNYTTADGLSSNHCIGLYQDGAGVIWAATTNGIDRLEGDRFATVPSLHNVFAWVVGEDQLGGLYLNTEFGFSRMKANRLVSISKDFYGLSMVVAHEGDLWLAGKGLVRIPGGALERWRGHDDPLDYEVFGPADGLDPTQCSNGHPSLALTNDHKLWAATPEGLAMLDLERLPKTVRKPSIYMREVTIGREVQPPGHELTLPPGTRHVELPFDTVELSSPEKTRFQYRLDSVDTEWLDADSSRRATYSNIPAGRHGFHLRASNRNGIWDRAGTIYYITQQPFFYETSSFRLAVVAVGLLLLAGLYRLRLQQATSSMNARLEVQLAERERIARELHDTLLQGFQGLMLHFQAALQQIPDQEPARQTMKQALGYADQVLVEGRERVRDLRSEGTVANELSQALASFGQELAKGHDVSFKVTVVGAARALHPVASDEIYRIAREALSNAFRHAKASSIDVEILYDRGSFRLSVRDNGRGMDREILDGGRQGHWGLSGMRERAQAMGGQLRVWSNSGAGTEIDLTVPSKVAYAGNRKKSRWAQFKFRKVSRGE